MKREHIEQMIADFEELRNLVDNYEGDFAELRKELNGERLDYDIFGVTYKSIYTSVYIVMGTYVVSNNIVVFDSQTHEMKRVSVSDLKKKVEGEDEITECAIIIITL